MAEVMTTKKPKKQKAAYPFPVKLIDQLLAQVENKDAESILGESDLAGQLKKMLAERMLSAELSHHLANEGEGSKNHRNGSSPKKLLTPGGELNLDIPRDRLSSFEPQAGRQASTAHAGLRRSRHQHVRRRHERARNPGAPAGVVCTEVSPDLISTITDEVLEEVTQWQQRPLEAMYPIVYFGALR